MINEKIKCVYVDDKIQLQLSYYLKKYDSLESKDVLFDVDDSYEKLLNNNDIRNANIVLIDSRLFENSNVGEEKYSGEVIMLMLKKIYPFIEVMVVSQNDDLNDINIIHKFKSSRGSTQDDAKKYYDEKLKPRIDESVNKIKIYKKLEMQLSKSKYIDKYLVDIIKNSINGITEYEALKKDDIDKLIQAFKDMESMK